jgi:hypothetical protein
MSERGARAQPSVLRRVLRIPLRFRLPNPPVQFVGRGAERLELAAALARAPVTVVSGLGGLGKTALSLSVLHGELAQAVPRALFVGLRPGEPIGQAILEVARALAASIDDRQPSWPQLLEDPEQSLELVLDLAEEAGAWVLIDDLHHAELAPARELLGGIARYARHSRWLVTSRVQLHGPELDLAGQQIVLASMAVDELDELARRWSPALDAGARRRLAVAAAGSPWQLRVLLGDAAATGPEHDLTAGLEPGAVGLLEALSVLDLPLAPDEIGAIVPAPSELLDDLERRGLLERSPAGVRLHDLARGLLRHSVPGDVAAGWAGRAAAALAESRTPPAWVEALRLRIGLGALAAARELLDARGAAALAAGYAPRLWQIVADVDDERLRAWRLRIAVELARPEPLARFGEPGGRAPEDRLLWARALHARGEVAAAAAVAGEVLHAPDAPAALRHRAGLLSLHAFFLLARPEDMAEALAALPVTSPEERAGADAYAALCRLLSGDARGASELAGRLARELGGLAPAARCEIGVRLAIVCFFLGRVRDGDEVLARAAAASAELPFRLNARMLLLLAADLAFCAGRLDELRELRARLEAHGALRRTHWAFVEFVAVFHGFAAGELAGLDERLATLVRRMQRAQDGRWLHAWAQYHAARLATARGRRTPEPAAGGAFPVPQAHARDMLQLVLLENWVRHGGAAAEVPDGAVDAFPDVFGVQARLVAAQVALANGHGETALVELASAASAADELGNGRFVVDARALRCEALLALGRRAELAVAAAELAALAAAMPSPRFAAEARFYALCADGPVPQPAALEALAAADEVAPVAARRARALLGETPALDVIDARVLDAVHAAGAPWRVERVGGAGPGPGFGLDGHRRELWIPDGRRVELAAQPLIWRCLETLAELGGAATREQLFRRVWGEAEYHPLRHKSRLHTTINRVRQAIEDDPDAPARLLTTEDGYRFGGGPVRWLRAVERM